MSTIYAHVDWVSLVRVSSLKTRALTDRTVIWAYFSRGAIENVSCVTIFFGQLINLFGMITD